MQAVFLKQLNHFLSTEESLVQNVAKTQAAIELAGERKRFLVHLRALAQSDDLALIIETEKTILEGDLRRYANSRAMVSSLNTALQAMEVIERHLALVANAETYRIVDQSHSMAKNRKAGLPFDEAKQALASHYTRLENLDKSRLDETEKETIEARKTLIAQAIAYYAQRQAHILGLAHNPFDKQA